MNLNELIAWHTLPVFNRFRYVKDVELKHGVYFHKCRAIPEEEVAGMFREFVNPPKDNQ